MGFGSRVFGNRLQQLHRLAAFKDVAQAAANPLVFCQSPISLGMGSQGALPFEMWLLDERSMAVDVEDGQELYHDYTALEVPCQGLHRAFWGPVKVSSAGCKKGGFPLGCLSQRPTAREFAVVQGAEP